MDGLYARYLPLAAERENFKQSTQIFGIYNVYRLVLSLVLLISFYYRTNSSPLGQINPDLFLQLTAFYIAFNVLTMFLPFFRMPATALALQHISIIILDLLILVLLSYTCGGVGSGMTHLLIVPVATGSILFGIRISTFFAAVGSIAAIYGEVYLYLSQPSAENFYVQAGLLGLILFAVSLCLQYLGGRIRQKDMINRQQAASIESLREINQQIIQRMQTGIVVVDEGTRVLNHNDSARKLLHMETLANGDMPLPRALVDQLELWKQDHEHRAPPFRVAENAPEVQANFTWLPGETSTNILIFLEDYSQLSSRAQHLKLMALGRLTASIAHEVRNPLGAISHASQLLGESMDISSEDQRLLSIINTHTDRVNSIIRNILELSRKPQQVAERIDLKPWTAQFIDRLHTSYREPIDCTLQCTTPHIWLRFNPSQLEQLLTNLCDNGLRYSKQQTGRASLTIQLSIHPFSHRPVLDVVDDGPGVAPERQEQIFEPFYTSEQSGTGLGLFICKEICEASQAQIFFRRTEDKRSCFRIIFAHPDRKIL